MAGENKVALFTPTARANLIDSVGAMTLDIPIKLEGQHHTIEIGINVRGAPVTAWEGDAGARDRLDEAVKQALTGHVTVKVRGNKSVQKLPFYMALADLIAFKMKDTM